ncbi:MAG: hypothetical protein ABI557_06200, partial [Aureliella sp.]
MKQPNRIFPCGLTRRELVWQMGGGFAGLALADLLASDGFFTRRLRANESPTQPLSAQPPQPTARAKSCIFLMMNGAPSQVDT